jgi:hypothetical protein
MAMARTSFAQDDRRDEGEEGGMPDKTAMACADCMVRCAKGMKHCVGQLVAGKKEYAKCLETCAGCMELCAATAKCCFGPMAATACQACAEACEACAAECQKLDDPKLEAAAKSCRECAEMCRMMAQHKGHRPGQEDARQ